MWKLKIECEGADMLPLSALTPMQGKLKDLTEEGIKKLIENFKADGFSAPFFIWKEGKTNWILDGHQRDRVLRLLEEDKDVTLPPKYPVVYIKARDKKHAAEKLLSISSQIGKITHDGLYEYLNTYGIKIEEIQCKVNFDAINIDKFAEGWSPENPTAGNGVNVATSFEVVVECSDEASQQALFERLSGEGYKCRVMSL